MFFKRKTICNHTFENIGMYYKMYLTEYRNRFDEVVVYNRHICSKCGYVQNEQVSREQFIPELYHSGSDKKEQYIETLEKNGIPNEIGLFIYKLHM